MTRQTILGFPRQFQTTICCQSWFVETTKHDLFMLSGQFVSPPIMDSNPNQTKVFGKTIVAAPTTMERLLD